MRNASFLGAVAVGLLIAGCGGDDTTVLPEETDTGALDDTGGTTSETGSETGDETSTGETGGETGDETSTGETGGETGGDGGTDTGMADTAMTDAGCGTLSATAVDVYVDKASSKPSVGTTECPFHTIKEATDLAAVSGRTIHVKGGTSASPAIYTETGVVTVKNGVTLLGDGLSVTRITNAATCTGGSMCAVDMLNGSTIDGFSITGSGNGIVTGAGDGPVTIKNVQVSLAQDGVLALGVVKITGGVQLNANKQSGLHGSAANPRTITISGTGNQFNENDGKGILAEGNSKIDATGGTASNNKQGGIYLASTVAPGTPHLITGFTVKTNGTSGATADGINVASTSSLKLRTTVLQANTRHGLSFVYSVSNVLDIGDGGGNSFSSVTDANKNGGAGVCLQNSGATGSVNGNGNKWAACGLLSPAVTQTIIMVECGAYAGGKVEIAYKKAASGGNDPVTVTAVTGCSTAP